MIYDAARFCVCVHILYIDVSLVIWWLLFVCEAASFQSIASL